MPTTNIDLYPNKDGVYTPIRPETSEEWRRAEMRSLARIVGYVCLFIGIGALCLPEGREIIYSHPLFAIAGAWGLFILWLICGKNRGKIEQEKAQEIMKLAKDWREQYELDKEKTQRDLEAANKLTAEYNEWEGRNR